MKVIIITYHCLDWPFYPYSLIRTLFGLKPDSFIKLMQQFGRCKSLPTSIEYYSLISLQSGQFLLVHL